MLKGAFNVTVFYHISTNLDHDGVFEPRIPTYRYENENCDIPRISVANSLEDCLTGIPGGGSRLEILNESQRGYYLLIKIDTEKLRIPKESIMSTKFLYEKDLVRDADVTNESWITEGFTVPEEDIELILLSDWSEESEDILPYSIYEIADKDYDGDYLEAYMDVYQPNIPCAVSIKNAQYISTKAKKGQTGILQSENSSDIDDLEVYIEHLDFIKILDVNAEFGTLEFEVIENGDLSGLFRFQVYLTSTFG